MTCIRVPAQESTGVSIGLFGPDFVGRAPIEEVDFTTLRLTLSCLAATAVYFGLRVARTIYMDNKSKDTPT